jgi:hypothetical protein
MYSGRQTTLKAWVDIIEISFIVSIICYIIYFSHLSPEWKAYTCIIATGIHCVFVVGWIKIYRSRCQAQMLIDPSENKIIIRYWEGSCLITIQCTIKDEEDKCYLINPVDYLTKKHRPDGVAIVLEKDGRYPCFGKVYRVVTNQASILCRDK